MKLPIALAALITIGAAFAPLPALAQPHISVIINTAPPAPIYERVPVARPGYVWAPGYWEWRGRRHDWIPGHYIAARPGYVYAPPSWHKRSGRWYMEPSRWDRGPHRGPHHGPVHVRGPDRHDHHDRGRHHGRRDSDGDGVRDKHDRDRDGDGVRNKHDRRPDNPYRY